MFQKTKPFDPETLGDYVQEAGYSKKHLGKHGKRYLVSIARE